MTNLCLSMEVFGLSNDAHKRSLAAAAEIFIAADVHPADCSGAAFEQEVDLEMFGFDPDADETDFKQRVLLRRPHADFDDEGRLASIWDDANAAAIAVIVEEMGDRAPVGTVLELREELSTESLIARQDWIETAMAEYRRSGFDRAASFAMARSDWEILTSRGTELEIADRVDPTTLAGETIEWRRQPSGELRPAYAIRSEFAEREVADDAEVAAL